MKRIFILLAVLLDLAGSVEAQSTLPLDKDAWTENVENWAMWNNLTIDPDAKVGKCSLRIKTAGKNSWHHAFLSKLPQLLDISDYRYLYVWVKRPSNTWIQLHLVDGAGRRWKHKLVTGIGPDWKLFEFKLDRKPEGEWATVAEGFDFSEIKQIFILFGAWQDVGINIWIDGLYFSKEKEQLNF